MSPEAICRLFSIIPGVGFHSHSPGWCIPHPRQHSRRRAKLRLALNIILTRTHSCGHKKDTRGGWEYNPHSGWLCAQLFSGHAMKQYSMFVNGRSTNSGLELLEFIAWICHLLAVWSWEKYKYSQCLHFLICKLEMNLLSALTL